VKGAASILKPLTDATKGKGGKATPVKWTEEMRTAFIQAKEALKEAATLVYPVDNAKDLCCHRCQ